VEAILKEMELETVPRLLALNKWDSLDEERKAWVLSRYPEGIAISARDRRACRPLVEAILDALGWEKELANTVESG